MRDRAVQKHESTWPFAKGAIFGRISSRATFLLAGTARILNGGFRLDVATTPGHQAGNDRMKETRSEVDMHRVESLRRSD